MHSDMHAEKPQPTTDADDLAPLHDAWKNTESGVSNPNKEVKPEFAIDFYAGSAMGDIGLRVGILGDLAARPDSDLEELRLRVVSDMGWIQKDLAVVYEAFRLLMKPARSK
jgi:hypothetical protein